MYLNYHQSAIATLQPIGHSDSDMGSQRARLLSGTSGYAAQCRALAARTLQPAHSRMSQPDETTVAAAGTSVPSTRAGQPSTLSVDSMCRPVEPDAMVDAGLTAVDYRKARHRLYHATIRKMHSGTCARATAILAKTPRISAVLFFREYWKNKCWQYASALAYHAGLSRSKRGLMDKTNAASARARNRGGSVGGMQGRCVAYRGMTLAELGQCADLPVGASVHLKVQYERDAPYHRGDDFHHWVTYLGAGKFTDSLHGSAYGGIIDRSLVRWVRRALHQRTYQHLHRAPYATRAQNRAKWTPIAGLQPKVTEIFMLPNRKRRRRGTATLR